jgi:hypothetical protein
MSALLRGLDEGLRTGVQLGNILRQGQQRRALADESARYNVTEGAYGPELEQNIEQVRGLMTEAQRQAAAQGGTVEDMARIEREYMPSIEELQRRSRMTAPDFTVASRAMRPEDTFTTREAATRAARPMRAEGLARVYEDFGDIERAEGLREQADTARMRASQIRRTEREDEQLGKLDKVNADAANWLNKRLTGEDGQLRAPTTEDTIAGIQHRASLLQQSGLADQAANALQQYTSIAANQISLQTAERNQALSSVAVAISAGDFGPVQDFYDRFIPDGAKVTDVKEGRDGRITVNRTTLDGEKLPATSFANRNEMLAALNNIRDPMSLYNYSQQEFQNTLAREKLEIQRRQAAQEKLSPLEKNLRTLQRLGIPVTDAQVKSMAGIDTGKLSPERDAQLKVLIETAKDIPPGDTKSRESISAAVSKLFTDQASEARLTEAVAGLQQAQRTGALPEAIATLRQQNIPEDAIAGLARAAGVPYTPPPGGPASAAATTPEQPGLQRRPVQLLQPLFDLQRSSRAQTELSGQNFNPYDTGGLR